MWVWLLSPKLEDNSVSQGNQTVVTDQWDQNPSVPPKSEYHRWATPGTHREVRNIKGRYPAYHNIGVHSWIIYSSTILTFGISHWFFLPVLYHTCQYFTFETSHFAYSSWYNISLTLMEQLKYYTQWTTAGKVSHFYFETSVLSHLACTSCEISHLFIHPGFLVEPSKGWILVILSKFASLVDCMYNITPKLSHIPHTTTYNMPSFKLSTIDTIKSFKSPLET